MIKLRSMLNYRLGTLESVWYFTFCFLLLVLLFFLTKVVMIALAVPGVAVLIYLFISESLNDKSEINFREDQVSKLLGVRLNGKVQCFKEDYHKALIDNYRKTIKGEALSLRFAFCGTRAIGHSDGLNWVPSKKSFYFNENASVSRVEYYIFEGFEVKWIYKYNSKNNLIETKSFGKGYENFENTLSFVRDSSEKLQEERMHKSGVGIDWIAKYKYDKRKKLIEKETKYSDDHFVVEAFNFRGKLIRESRYRDKQLYYEEIRIYNELGYCVESKAYRNGNELCSTDNSRYDISGNCLESSLELHLGDNAYEGNHKITSIYAHGRKIKEIHNKYYNTEDVSWTYKYDSYGTMIEAIKFNSELVQVETRTYKNEYDHMNNLTGCIEFINGIPVSIYQSTILYYK